MAVLLRRSDDLPEESAFQSWFAVTGTDCSLPADRKLPELAMRLEEAYEASAELCWQIGAGLSKDSSAEIALTPTVGAYGTDLCLMLAWERLTESLASPGTPPEQRPGLVVCDDPWLFRHLAGLAGVTPGRPPALGPARWRLWIRGLFSRARVVVRVALAAVAMRGTRKALAPGDAVLLVYGHPESNAAGHDAYYGDLMGRVASVKRALHTDCPAARARELCADGRTASLHAWGSPLFALGLIFFARWKPSAAHTGGAHGWIVRRARDMENGGGGGAMTRWQIHCQDRWLDSAKPVRMTWPWENFAWERALCRSARNRGVPTIGYQHTAVGRHQLNFSPATNPDGLDSIPDLIACNGPAYMRSLRDWRIPEERLMDAGAFRIRRTGKRLYDPDGPVFVPLSGLLTMARRQMSAARLIAASGRKVLIKEHPMYPLDFEQTPNLRRTQRPMGEMDGISAVLFCTGTTGLEALLAGVPTYRLIMDDRISVNVLPSGFTVPAVTQETAAGALEENQIIPTHSWEDVFSDVKIDLWRRLLDGREPFPGGRLQ